MLTASGVARTRKTRKRRDGTVKGPEMAAGFPTRSLECPFITGPRDSHRPRGPRAKDVVVIAEEALEGPIKGDTEGQYLVSVLRANNLNCHMERKFPYILSELSQNVMTLISEINLKMYNWQNQLTIAGRLQFFLENWLKVTRDHYIIQLVKGYKLELESQPFQNHSPGQPSFSSKEKMALDKEVNKLVEKRAIEIVSPMSNQFISHMFLVPKKDGGMRPVINLRALNNFIIYQHFKMEGLYMVKDLLIQGDWMCKIDLKDAYLTMNIDLESRKYLRFQWQNKLFQFNCLPFGLASAPRVYTKLMKPVISLLRKAGIRLIIYLDDILLMAETKEKLIQARDSTLFLLLNLGFVINWEKSKVNPSQVLDFLGFQIDSQKMMFHLAEEKITKLKVSCREILSAKKVSVRDLAKITGKLVSTLQAIIPANLQCRFLQMLQTKSLMSGKTYESKISLTSEAREELLWWVNQIEQSNGRSIISVTPDLVLTTDASNEGWVAVCRGIRTGGIWTPEERHCI